MTFIGPVPVVDTPRFVTPFRVEDDEILDARGTRVATGNTPNYGDDLRMARVIADALNEKYGPKPAEAR